MRNRLLLIGLLAVSVIPWPEARAGPPEELAGRADSAREVALAAISDPTEERMDEVRSALGLPDQITAHGRSIELPADPFLGGLEGTSAADFRAAARHLEEVAASLRSFESAQPVERAALEDDLNLAYAGIDEAPGWIERIGRALRSFVVALARGLSSPGIPALVGWGLVLALLVLLLWAGRRLGFRTVPAAMLEDRILAQNPAEWRRRAEGARARGDLVEAVVLLYRSLVAGLAERGIVTDRPSLTAREVRAAAPASLAAAVSEATARYEGVRYGSRPPDEQDLRALETAARLVTTG